MKFIITMLLLGCIHVAQAQPEDIGDDPIQNDVPVDGGISLLAAAAAGYGAYKQAKAKKAQPTSK